jgi:glyoxylase-like metal-dependent hydrolase (beta-lactamase superfamily II)
MIPGTQAAFKLITDRTTRIKPGAEVVSGIGTVESRGHTPGHMSILIASNGEQALVIGDAITNQLINFAHPRLEAELWVFDRVIDDSAIV